MTGVFVRREETQREHCVETDRLKLPVHKPTSAGKLQELEEEGEPGSGGLL